MVLAKGIRFLASRSLIVYSCQQDKKKNELAAKSKGNTLKSLLGGIFLQGKRHGVESIYNISFIS